MSCFCVRPWWVLDGCILYDLNYYILILLKFNYLLCTLHTRAAYWTYGISISANQKSRKLGVFLSEVGVKPSHIILTDMRENGTDMLRYGLFLFDNVFGCQK